MSVSNLVVGEGFGPEFEITGAITPNKIRLKLGATLMVAVDGTINTVSPTITTDTVDKTYLASATISGDGNQANTVLTLTNVRADTGWTKVGNQYVYSGSPDKVRIDTNAFYGNTNGGNQPALARISPVLEILRNNTVIARVETGYQRHVTNHASSSNGVGYTDPFPGVNPAYSVRADQGSNQNDNLQITLGHFTLDAVEKITVITSIT